MKTSTLLIGAALLGVVYLLYKESQKIAAQNPQGVAGGTSLAANTSSIGSSSGILVPILQGTGGLLNGVEAFLDPSAYGNKVTTTIAQNVQTNVQNSGITTTDDTSYVGLLDPSIASSSDVYGSLDTSDATQALYS